MRRIHRKQITVEGFIRVAVHAPSAREQLLGIRQMRRAERMHVHMRTGLRQMAGGARMIQMDVREQQMSDVRQRNPCRAQAIDQRAARGGRPALHEQMTIDAADQERVGRARHPHVTHIDRLHLHGGPHAADREARTITRSAPSIAMNAQMPTDP